MDNVDNSPTNQLWEIYETVNTENGKTYVGQHRRTKTCRGTVDAQNCKYKGSGTAIMKALKKYGRGAFMKRVICLALSQKEADEKEREQILLAKVTAAANTISMRATEPIRLRLTGTTPIGIRRTSTVKSK